MLETTINGPCKFILLMFLRKKKKNHKLDILMEFMYRCMVFLIDLDAAGVHEYVMVGIAL